ncbi:MAG: hypothetical protein FWF65_09870 [Bacteroidetes bacterium]|nr:hypothetical protein [Bacteroidota bacterium]
MNKKEKAEKKLRFYPAETFKEITLEHSSKLQLCYAISNYGRLVSFNDNIEEGRLVKGSKLEGYRIWRYKIRDSNNKLRHKHCFLYKLVAEYFISKTSDDQIYVLHLDRNRSNDHVENLKWATKAERIEHSKSSPYVIEARKKQLAELRAKRKHQGNKLTSTQVMLIKKIISDPNRKTRLKLIAKRFGVTTMTLQRIKTGENWGHIKI